MSTPKLLAFDIEISNVFDLRSGEDINAYAPFDIAVAATQVYDAAPRLWYSADAAGKPTSQLDRATAAELLSYLDQMQQEGFAVCAWNGLGFDMRWIARAAGDVAAASRVARAMYDPMFQFYKVKGFPVALAAVGAGLGISTKKSMSGADAPREWQAGNYEAVFEYVQGDVRLTLEIIRAVERNRKIAWITRNGTRTAVPIAGLRTVADCMRDPMPDQSWMSSPIPQAQFTQWLSA